MSEENENLRDNDSKCAAEDKEGTRTDVNAAGVSAIENADRLHIYRRSVLWIALIAVAVRLTAFFTAFDTDIGYFNRNNIFPVTSDALLAIAALWTITAAFVFRKRDGMIRSPEFSGGAVYFAGLYAGFIFIADAVYKAYTFADSYRSGKLDSILERFKNPKYYQTQADKIARILAVIAVLGFISSVLASVYFLRGSDGKKKNGQTWLGFFVIIRCLCGIARIYFDMNVPMNNPCKLLCEISLMSVMLYFLTEERFIIGEEKARPHLFIASGLAAFLFSTVAGVTSVVGFFTGVAPYAEYCAEGIVMLTCALYIFTRLFVYEKITRAPVVLPIADASDTETSDVETDAESK